MIFSIQRADAMKLTVLILTFVFGMASASADDKFTCPVTKPTPVTFVAPGIFEKQQADLFGTEKLFTFFWGDRRPAQKTELGYRFPKVLWGSATFDLKQELTYSSLTITGR